MNCAESVQAWPQTIETVRFELSSLHASIATFIANLD